MGLPAFLHDLNDAPFEMTNLIDDRPDEAADLRSRLLGLLAETREPFFGGLIEHGVESERTRYITHEDVQLRNITHQGGIGD